MRKLRDDITLKEAWEWAEKKAPEYSYGYKDEIIADLIRQIARGVPDDDYPDSFYEQPPIGSFGEFHTDGISWWGYLAEISKSGRYRGEHIGWYDNFEPSLPQDVDKEGMPI